MSNKIIGLFEGNRNRILVLVIISVFSLLTAIAVPVVTALTEFHSNKEIRQELEQCNNDYVRQSSLLREYFAVAEKEEEIMEEMTSLAVVEPDTVQLGYPTIKIRVPKLESQEILNTIKEEL